jgi:5-methylcytosine-specific restriction endonuclease McrA
MNVVTACRGCNTIKGGRTPEAARMPLLYAPYVPNRHEHWCSKTDESCRIRWST